MINYVLPLILILTLAACAGTPTAPVVSNPAPTLPPPVLPTIAANPPSEPTAGDAPVINYNDVKEGVIDEPGAVDDWVFNAQAGERVNVVLNSQFDSYLELYNPAGELVASNDDSGGNLTAALLNVPISTSGPHRLNVRGYDNDMGSYALALTGGHPTVGGGQLNSGDSRNVMLSDQGYKWRYQGEQGTYLNISVQGADGVDAVLSLYGPDGVLLTSDDDSGGNLNPEIYDFALPATGLYTVRANTIASTGLVTLTLTTSEQSSGGGPLAVGQGQVGTLKPGREHLWTFTAEPGQVVNISLVSPEFDTFVELRNAQGEILAENDDGPDGSNALISNFAMPAAETYTVAVRSATGETGGAYELTVKPVKVTVGGGPLTPDKPIQAALAPNQTDSYTFTAAAGTFVTVRVTSDQLDSYLELYNSDNELLVSDDDSGGSLNAALLDFPAPAAGEYRAVVKSARPESTPSGVYEILLTVTEAMATAGRLETGQRETVELEAGQQDTWTFEAQEDDFVTVKLESDTLDTYLSLYDSSGELLAVNDDFFAKQAAIANFIVPKTGEYRLVARSYSPEEAGSYTISLEITAEELPLNPSAPNNN